LWNVIKQKIKKIIGSCLFSVDRRERRRSIKHYRYIAALQSMKNKVHVLHQTGSRQLEEIKKAYEQSVFRRKLRLSLFDMAGAYADADLIICRAGATSLAEITAAGKAAILIPYPWAAKRPSIEKMHRLWLRKAPLS